MLGPNAIGDPSRDDTPRELMAYGRLDTKTQVRNKTFPERVSNLFGRRSAQSCVGGGSHPTVAPTADTPVPEAPGASTPHWQMHLVFRNSKSNDEKTNCEIDVLTRLTANRGWENRLSCSTRLRFSVSGSGRLSVRLAMTS
jgi:hypothetical protein